MEQASTSPAIVARVKAVRARDIDYHSKRLEETEATKKATQPPEPGVRDAGAERNQVGGASSSGPSAPTAGPSAPTAETRPRKRPAEYQANPDEPGVAQGAMPPDMAMDPVPQSRKREHQMNPRRARR